MTSQELHGYISARNEELSNDEIKLVTDTERNPDINHIVFENGTWQMWDCYGNYYSFRKRNWK